MNGISRRRFMGHVTVGTAALSWGVVSPAEAPVEAVVQGRRLPSWKLQHGWADETPTSPVESSEPLQQLTLIPYGCTNIRITEFPRLKR